jgi:hypothetical protein
VFVGCKFYCIHGASFSYFSIASNIRLFLR